MNKQSLDNSLKNLKLKLPIYNKKKIKVFNKDFSILKFNEYNDLIIKDYNVAQLKQMCGEYKILKSGKKDELIDKIYKYLYFSNKIVNIQKIYRLFLVKVYNKSHGPAFKNRKLCVNETDFLTLEDISEIPYSQFFSYKDMDGMIYGFNISSLYEYLFKKDNKSNPYTRGNIPKNTISDIRRLIKLSKIMNIDMEIKIKDDIICPKKTFELKVIDIFNKIDELGNYSDYLWFYRLDKNNLIRYIRELYDIWSYRLQLTNTIKRNVCPRGDPFRNINLYNILNHDVFILKKIISSVLEEFVTSGINTESRSLGAIYVLTALTLVSHEAATAMPWLYHSVMPI